MEKEVKISQLLDVYGKTLKKNNYDVLDYYYNQDLSLSEISDILSITRQGVRDLIKRSEEYLLDLESKLEFRKKYDFLRDRLCQVEESVDKILSLNSSNNVSDEMISEVLRIKNISRTLIDM